MSSAEYGTQRKRAPGLSFSGSQEGEGEGTLRRVMIAGVQCVVTGGCGWVAQSCPTLCDPWTVARQAPLSMGFSRHEYQGGSPFPSPGDLPDPEIEPPSPALAGGFFTAKPPGTDTEGGAYIRYLSAFSPPLHQTYCRLLFHRGYLFQSQPSNRLTSKQQNMCYYGSRVLARWGRASVCLGGLNWPRELVSGSSQGLRVLLRRTPEPPTASEIVIPFTQGWVPIKLKVTQLHRGKKPSCSFTDLHLSPRDNFSSLLGVTDRFWPSLLLRFLVEGPHFLLPRL